MEMVTVVMPKKMTRGERVGRQFADGTIEMIHLMYQKDTARRVIDAIVVRLDERRKEFER